MPPNWVGSRSRSSRADRWLLATLPNNLRAPHPQSTDQSPGLPPHEIVRRCISPRSSWTRCAVRGCMRLMKVPDVPSVTTVEETVLKEVSTETMFKRICRKTSSTKLQPSWLPERRANPSHAHRYRSKVACHQSVCLHRLTLPLKRDPTQRDWDAEFGVMWWRMRLTHWSKTCHAHCTSGTNKKIV